MQLFVKRFSLGVCSLLLMTLSAYAESGGWRVVESSGTVRMALPLATPQLVSTQDVLQANSILTTGFDGRVVLNRDEQQIIVGPNSRMSLPATEEPGMTRILQDLGTLLFKVDKREKKHFRVETPIIAAVVKGTTFTVTAAPDAHIVHVAEGAVEVSSRNAGTPRLVTAGLTARVARANPSVIEYTKDRVKDNLKPKDSAVDHTAREKPSSDGARGVIGLQNAAAKSGGVATAGNRQFIIPDDIGGKSIDFDAVTKGLTQSPENSAARTARMQQRGAIPSSDGASRPASGIVESISRMATNNNNLANIARPDTPHNASDFFENGNGNSTAGGSGNGAVGGSGNSNAGGSGNSTAGGSGNSTVGGSGNSNAGGSGNGNAGGNGNGNAGGSGNSNAGGSGNGNAGGNGNGNAGGSGNSNAGGSGNGNAGGNGNGNAGGNGNGNAGGNGNGNAGGNGNSNAGGNGNSNAGGSGNGNAGGNGNGNAGGNGNGNAGGNGNGNGNGNGG